MDVTGYLEGLLTRLTSASLNDETSDLDKEVAESVKFLAGLSEEQIVQEDVFPLVFQLTRKLLSVSLRRMSAYKKRVNRLEKEVRTMKRVLQLHQATFQNTLHNALQCPLCPKQFLDQSFLDYHAKKRHPDTSLDAASSTPLMNRLSMLSSSFIGDRDVDRLAEQLNILTEKMDKTEDLLKQEKDARTSLATQIVTRVEDLEENLSKKITAQVSSTDQTSMKSPVIPESKTSPENMEQVIKKQFEEVQKISQEMTQLKKKMNGNKHHERRSSTSSKKGHYAETEIQTILRQYLKKLGIEQEEVGVNQDKFVRAMQTLQEERNKKSKSEKHSTKDSLKKKEIVSEETMVSCKTKESKDTKETKVLKPPDVSTQETPTKSVKQKKMSPSTKPESPETSKTLTSILKSNSVDRLDKKSSRKISFNDKRIEIRFDDSAESELEEEVLKWSGEDDDNEAPAEEEGDRQSPVPPPTAADRQSKEHATYPTAKARLSLSHQTSL